ncbi:MAG: hypothetical protein AB1716_19245 [Planctomycetota bacterium]
MSSHVSKTLVGILALGIVGGAVYFAQRGRARPPHQPEHLRIVGVCLACGKDVEATLAIDELPPAACSSCNQRAVFPLMYCQACRKTFVPRLVKAHDGAWRSEPYPSCTGCGAGGAIAYEPAWIEQPPAGRIALPKWPPG